MTDLFGHGPVRRPRRVMMHAVDSGLSIRGRSAAHFCCGTCGHDNGWSEIPPTRTALHRGLPCPKCNTTLVIGVDLSSQPDQAVEVEWQDGRILSVREAPRA